jgi:hypothetical protein
MKKRALVTRLRAARSLLREWRDSVYVCHREMIPGPSYGKVTDPATLRELERFDEAYAALTEAIKAAEVA